MEIAKAVKQTKEYASIFLFPFFPPPPNLDRITVPCPVDALNFQNGLSDIFKLFYITDNAACLSWIQGFGFAWWTLKPGLASQEFFYQGLWPCILHAHKFMHEVLHFFHTDMFIELFHSVRVVWKGSFREKVECSAT